MTKAPRATERATGRASDLADVGPPAGEPRFFETPAALRDWLLALADRNR